MLISSYPKISCFHLVFIPVCVIIIYLNKKLRPTNLKKLYNDGNINLTVLYIKNMNSIICSLQLIK